MSDGDLREHALAGKGHGGKGGGRHAWKEVLGGGNRSGAGKEVWRIACWWSEGGVMRQGQEGGREKG